MLAGGIRFVINVYTEVKATQLQKCRDVTQIQEPGFYQVSGLVKEETRDQVVQTTHITVARVNVETLTSLF